MKKMAFLGQPNCYQLSNGTVEAVVTTDIGPRIIRYGFAGGENVLGECPEAKVETKLGTWRPWGGHRLWTAPESNPRSYVPDNTPIQFETSGTNSIRLVQPVEPETHVEKEMMVTLDETGTRLKIEHKITNRGLWGVDLAPWALTIMNGTGGGTVILPQEPYRTHDEALMPARAMVLWHYTDLSDRRWTLGPKFVRLNVDKALTEPQKVGIANKQGWAGYVHKKTLFVKRFGYEDETVYPDDGCNCEAYTAGSFVEVETLGPMHHLEPEEWATHTEHWHLFKDVKVGETDDAAEAVLRPLVEETS